MKRMVRPEVDSLFWKRVLPPLIFVALVLVIVPRFTDIHESYDIARSAKVEVLGIALIFLVCSVTASALTYYALTRRQVSFRRILLIMWAGMFVNRLLPAGVGGMGLAARFLYRHGYSVGRASTVVVMNNLLGFFGHLLLIVLAIVLLNSATPASGSILSETIYKEWGRMLIILCVLAFAGVFIAGRIRRIRKVKRFTKEVGTAIKEFRHSPFALISAQAGSLCNTTFHVLMLWATMLAFGMPLGLGAVIIVLTSGVLFATVSPTPGGLGGSEAGVSAMLVAFGIPLATALAVAVTYRLISYWLPLVPGAVSLAIAQKKRYV